jgi:hypothetical protein
MELISSVAVGSGGATSITFSSIPATYTDLIVLYSGRGSQTIAQPALNLNSSASSFTNRVVYSDSGASTATYAGTTDLIRVDDTTQTANTFASGRIYITNYASSANKYLQFDVVTEDNSSGSFKGIGSTQWANTAAITSITLNMSSWGGWVENSTAYLYGTLKGSGGATVA